MAKRVKYPKLRKTLLRSRGEKTQAWVAEQCGVSQPAYNDWENGYDRPLRTHLVHLAFVLNLNPYLLAEAADYKPDELETLQLLVERSNLRANYDRLIAYFEDRVKMYQGRRIIGDPDLVKEWGGGTIKASKNLARAAPAPYQEIFYKICGQLHIQQGWAYSETSSIDEVWTAKISLVQNLRSLAKESANPEYLGFAHQFLADAYHIVRKRDLSMKHLIRALETVKDPAQRLHLYRTQAFVLASRYDKEGFKQKCQQIERGIKAIIKRGEFSDLELERLIEAYDALARGQAKFGWEEALDTMEKGLYFLTELKRRYKSPSLREIQMGRTKFDVIKELQPKNIRDLESEGKKLIALAGKKYQRLAWHIKRALG